MEVNVAAELGSVPLTLDRHGLEAPLEQVPCATPPPVQCDRERGGQPLHGAASIGRWCHHLQMEMVGHPTIAQHLDAKLGGGQPQPLKERLVIRILSENDLP